MNPEDVYVVKKNINGQEIPLEVCDEGEYTTVNPKCYDKLFGGTKRHTIKELLLLLLGVDPEIPLKRTLLMKEAFLFEKELSFKLNLYFEPLKFYPHRYGPYSKVLDDTIESISDLLIIDSSSRKKEIKLSNLGKIEANNFIKTLPEDKINEIKFARIGWDQYGNKGILKRVYTDYPAYTKNSEIKNDVLR